MANIYRVEFQIVKTAPVGKAGPAYAYRRAPRLALVSAANDQSVQGILNADIPLTGGEVIEVIAVGPIHLGTEGVAVLT